MKHTKITDIRGFELMDSRGNPTVGARVTLEDGSSGFAVSPSGASTGEFEAFELRDNDKKRYLGKGVKKAAENINGEIFKSLAGQDAANQRNTDRIMIELDGTPNKSRLGANAILAVSLAAAKAAAACYGMPLYRYLGGINAVTLPRPMMNILNGGAHAANNIDIQEFMIIPVRAQSFSEGLRCCSEIYHTLGKIIKARGLSAGVGDEGGFAPDLESDEKAIELIMEAVNKSGYTEEDINIALDIASSEWYREGQYHLPKRNVSMTAGQLIDYYEGLCGKYPIISIEDGVAEDDWDSWGLLTQRLGDRIQLVGDDLFVTNTERLKKGINLNCANSVLVKPNQIGSLSETLNVVLCAQKHGYSAVISHRSGETEDTTIADIAVGLNAGQIKTGAPCRSDRVSKYNRLLIIENEIHS